MINLFPDVYLFNPTCEYAIANGNASWQPNRLLQKMESDLATLPLFLAECKDYVIVEKLPSGDFINSLKRLKIEIPKFILKSKINNLLFLEKRKNKLLPWGWSPAAHKLLSSLKENCSPQFKHSPVSNWNKNSRDLYSKKFALEILTNLIGEYPNDCFIPQSQQTKVCTKKEELVFLLKKWGKLMIKAPWSSSGRGLQPITKTPVHEKVWEKVIGIIKEQGYVIVEPYLNKVLDLAFQFKLEKGKVIFLGISNFTTDRKGQYLGNNLNGLPEKTSDQIKNFAKTIPEFIIEPISKIIEKSNLAKFYEGYFGVDTLLYVDKNNKIKVNPCMEINVRQNMGLLSLSLEKLLVKGRKGVFRTFFQPGKTFLQFKKEMEEKYPLQLTNSKINSGFIALSEAQNDTLFGAYILI